MIAAALLLAGSYGGVAVIAVWRALRQGTEAPELHHVLPVGFACAVAAVGFGAFAALVPLELAEDPGSSLALLVAAAGMLGVVLLLGFAAPRIAAQPTTLTVVPTRRESSRFRRLHERWRQADALQADAHGIRVALAVVLWGPTDPRVAHVSRGG